MQNEAIRKLDELIERVIGRHEDEYDYDADRTAWAALRAELTTARLEPTPEAQGANASGRVDNRCVMES